MAQENFLHDDDGRVVTGSNGNTTSVILAGDILFASGPSTSPFGTTVPSTITYDDIQVEPLKYTASAAVKTVGGRVVGIALHDAAAGSQVAFVTRGIFLSPVVATTSVLYPGDLVMGNGSSTTAGVNKCGTTVGATAAERLTCIGRSLTGAATSGDYVMWLLNIR